MFQLLRQFTVEHNEDNSVRRMETDWRGSSHGSPQRSILAFTWQRSSKNHKMCQESCAIDDSQAWYLSNKRQSNKELI
jgi:hypothetical protein